MAGIIELVEQSSKVNGVPGDARRVIGLGRLDDFAGVSGKMPDELALFGRLQGDELLAGAGPGGSPLLP